MDHHQSENIELKTYARFPNKTKKVYTPGALEKKDDIKVPLTTLNAVKYLLEGTLRLRVCRYCLNVTSKLSEFEEVLTLAVSGNLHEVTIRDIVASFHPYKVPEDKNFPNKICNECVNQAISCYLFTQQCERAERALWNCLDDVNYKFDKLDPIEPMKKRGKRKLNPNHNIIYTEHKNVINYAQPVINIVNTTEDSSVWYKDKMSHLECQKCWQVLPNVESLINHENSHPRSMWFSCRLCGKSFVKRPQLRRHLKEKHSYNEETTQENTNDWFKCKECGEENKLLGEHLQHNEKHKFKTTFELLVERKVDSLCTVCLEKSSRLMNLSEVVQLHGGYSGLTGEKRMEDVLKAAIPGPNPYKYNELIVPHHATIHTLIKEKLEMAKRSQNFNETETLTLPQELEEMFIFPLPISVEKREIFKSSVAFTFLEPYLLNSFQDSSKVSVLEKTLGLNQDNKQTDELNTVENVLQETHIKEEREAEFHFTSSFVFSQPYFLESIQAANNRDENNVVDIYSETVSKEMCSEQETTHTANSELTQDIIAIKGTNPREIVCIVNCEANINVLEDEKWNEDVIKEDDCKYCWIFSKSGRCNQCKKYINSNNFLLTLRLMK